MVRYKVGRGAGTVGILGEGGQAAIQVSGCNIMSQIAQRVPKFGDIVPKKSGHPIA